MQRTIWFVCSVLLIAWAVASYMSMKQDEQHFNYLQELKPEQTVEVWASSIAVIQLAEQYQQSHPHIQIKTRFFHDQELLLEELYGAVSAGTSPHIAEINAHYGLFQLVQSGVLIQLDEKLPAEMTEDLVPGVSSRYQWKDSLWAWPIGTSLPVIYSNKTMLQHHGMSNANDVKTWDELYHLARQLSKQLKERNQRHYWTIHADRLTPWYMLSILKQTRSVLPELPQMTGALFAEWDRAVNEDHLMPSLTHQLAITQFVSGQGAFLISTTEQMSLIKKLIAGKFELDVMPFPSLKRNGPRGYVAGGSGLAAFRMDDEDDEQALRFIQYAAELERSAELSRQANYIPARLSALTGDEGYHSFDAEHVWIHEAMKIDPMPLSANDQARWAKLLEIQEEIESKSIE